MQLDDRVTNALQTVVDPELGVSIVELGLIYAIRIEQRSIEVDLTLTSAACPLSEQLAREIEERLLALGDVDAVKVKLVWEPPWSPDRMSESARRDLGWT